MKKMLISFTAGLILGILYAPAKGEDTRRKLSDMGSDIKDGWDNITDAISERIDSIKDSVNNVTGKGSTDYRDEQMNFEDRAGYL